MRFLSEGIGELVLAKLDKAIEARLAVAFFNPNDRMLRVLAGISNVKLIVSEEYTFNNPYKLEKLQTAALRSVPPYDANGKLHAKVLIIKLQDDSYWILLGSANLTHQGMFSNQEACVVMESDNPEDETSVREIRGWFDSLFQSAHPLNLDQAKVIYDARSQYRLVSRPSERLAIDVGYWALKTTSGSSGKEYWPMFLEESVIAIGWNEISLDPSKVSDAQLRVAHKETFASSDNEANQSTVQIRNFVDLKRDDIVLICRGYNSTQKKDVHI